ncbi:MAG: hypothetical protein A2365_03295 [Candidatus Nealsonbacteria bacterium RIFOXYB1_FULL_40_15]|uniref:General secretion pathway GspH domain-containing protein n=1 Tax=Candidatus Nealsonbacteria bacterium RIFOXYB1_FULL_40_15 TaxID=1801677 RepID=A0A1G2EQ50_9BACT|nr:MAG: hypothetical protein A2365_03295 [Candidatus Nealsonbacteria bacterium RIFOXYB1_FULL_40_15]
MNKGITFVEVIIVISVIAILSLLSFPYYNDIRNTLALDRTAAQIVQDIRRAQEMAMSAHQTTSGGNGTLHIPAGGYGVYFTDDSESYTIFGDEKPNPSNPNSTPNNYRNPNGEEDIEDVLVEENVWISDLKDSSDTSRNTISTTFLAPNPKVFLQDGNTGLGPEVKIRVSLKSDSSRFRDIKVNKAGLIWIE